jgi:hypothetical protein
VVLKVTAPAARGDYTFKIDLVREGAAWFEALGSEVALLPITVA